MRLYRNCNGKYDITTKDAVQQSSLSIEELFANLIDQLSKNNKLTLDQIAEIFYWDYEVEE